MGDESELAHVSACHPRRDIDYPSSDGKPMAETEIHAREMLFTMGTLDLYYDDRNDVYVAANNFIYYEEGDRDARFSPDVYVVLGVKKKIRRSTKPGSRRRSPRSFSKPVRAARG